MRRKLPIHLVIASTFLSLSLTAAESVAPSEKAVSAPEVNETEVVTRPEVYKAMGYAIAKNFALDMGYSADQLDSIMAGIKDAATGEPDYPEMQSLLKEAGAIYTKKAEEVRKLEEVKREQMAQENIAKGKEFLAEIASEEGVQKSDSGLYYKILNAGDSTIVAENTDRVKVDYEGKRIDGTVFDSSIERGAPATFMVKGVVPGFSEGLKLIGQGGEIMLYIPSNLGYGNSPQPGGKIQPGDLLVFKVKIHEVLKAPKGLPDNLGTPPPLPPDLKPPQLPPNMKAPKGPPPSAPTQVKK
jgi:FKBP-type peptidyl-prolyl cis-trans isomerase